MLREMFAGPVSQKLFASLWLLAIVGCLYGIADVFYLYVTHKV